MWSDGTFHTSQMFETDWLSNGSAPYIYTPVASLTAKRGQAEQNKSLWTPTEMTRMTGSPCAPGGNVRISLTVSRCTVCTCTVPWNLRWEPHPKGGVGGSHTRPVVESTSPIRNSISQTILNFVKFNDSKQIIPH